LRLSPARLWFNRGHFVPPHARVLILARDDALALSLAAGLSPLGWPAVTARGRYAALAALSDPNIEAAIVDVASYGAEALGLAKQLKAACGARRLPVIAVGAPELGFESRAFDLTLTAPLHPVQAARRLESLVRTAVAEEEFELRLETFAARGRRLELPDEHAGPYQVLAVGEPTPQFLALSNALSRSGIEPVGAFTAYTAFDYLHERAFDAVVLWGGDNDSEALSIAAGMRRNTRLYHIPTLLYLKAEAADALAEMFYRGISDVASPDTPETETAKRVLELARAHRRQAAVRTALDQARSSGLMDPATGLFTRDLFAAHLLGLTSASRLRNRPLSLCVLKMIDRPELEPVREGGWVDRAIPQIGSMIARLVRAEDTAARLGPELFAIAFPATTAQAARAAADRICAVIGYTAFEAGDKRPPFVVEFEVGVAEVEADESAAKALERAAAKAKPARRRMTSRAKSKSGSAL
jgi:two-component system cell cycle response regulator PopA